MIPQETRQLLFDCYRLLPGGWCGDLDEVTFLKRLWNLQEIRSTDGRFSDAEGDIYQHRYNNLDWENDWVFSDGRFALETCDDEILAKFIEQTVHPVVRKDPDNATQLVRELSGVLSKTNWELVEGPSLVGRKTWTMRHRVVEGGDGKVELTSHLERRGFAMGKMLGSGASGEVFLATQKNLDRQVAIKVCIAGDPKTRRRFEHEATILAKIQHRSIPYVVTRGESGGTPYTVMQFVGGQSVRELLEEKGKLSREIACQIVLDVLSGVSAAHALSLVHRDIKPENILVDGKQAFLIDFSIGAALEHLKGLTRVTTSGNVPGTTFYMAPEVLEGKAWDQRIDIFATGAVLFEMLTGKLWAIAQNNLSHAVDAHLAQVIRKACMSDPAERFQSADELAAAIGKAVAYQEKRSDPADAICPSPSCPDAHWQPGFLPSLKHDVTDGYCRDCGTPLLYECSRCRASLDPQARFCSSCGTAFYVVPQCRECGELLERKEVRKGICESCDAAIPF